MIPLEIKKGKKFSGLLVLKNPPSQAGGAGSTLGQETKMPHVVDQLSPHRTTTEACTLQQRLSADKIKKKKTTLIKKRR